MEVHITCHLHELATGDMFLKGLIPALVFEQTSPLGDHASNLTQKAYLEKTSVVHSMTFALLLCMDCGKCG